MASASASRAAKVKKVVLFGPRGDGKSTIANVLVAGDLEPVIFASSDAPSGCTTAIQKKSGRGWTVTDTVGLSEADVGTMSNTEAKEKLINFLKDVKDEYSHIIYVLKATKVTKTEEIIWKLFAKIFEGAEEAFVILITGATTDWLEENRGKFPECWRNQNVLGTEIPPIHSQPSIERRLKVIRQQSIRKLEKGLDKLLEDRGNRYSTPDIARLNEEQLEQVSLAVLGYGRLVLQSQLSDQDQGVLENDAGRVAETVSHSSTTSFVEDFIRDVTAGGEDGYFVSSTWLLNLEEHEKDSLISCLRRAGYSESYQTSTTTLFART